MQEKSAVGLFSETDETGRGATSLLQMPVWAFHKMPTSFIHLKTSGVNTSP